MSTTPEAQPSSAPSDPAGEALSDALRVSFNLLRLAIVALLVVFLLSGTRNVREGTVAVRVIAGAIVGEPGQQVLEPGGPYLWPPEPIGSFIVLPTSVQEVRLDDTASFWFEVQEGEELRPLDELTATSTLIPGRDGSLLTADRNVAHGKWIINYRIRPQGAVDYLRNTAGAERSLARADSLVAGLSRRAIVRAVASTGIDDLIRSRIDREAIARDINVELDALSSGLEVTQVLLGEPTPPLAVRQAFQAVSQAEADRVRSIAEARTAATTILVGAAGETYDALLTAIDDFETTSRRARSGLGESEDLERASQRIDELLGQSSGEVARRLGTALQERRRIEAEVLEEVDEFKKLLPHYQKSRESLLARRWQDTLERILSSDVETFYYPADRELYLEIPPDPRVRKARERRRTQGVGR